MEKEELTELANNKEFQELVKETEIGNKFKFKNRHFQIKKCPECGLICRCCIFFKTDGDKCINVPCVKNGIDINIIKISETEYKNKNITICQLENIAKNDEDYHIIFENQNAIEPHEFGIDKELKEKICKVMIDYYNNE